MYTNHVNKNKRLVVSSWRSILKTHSLDSEKVTMKEVHG